MKKFILLIIITYLSVISLFASPMHGTYTIGGSSPDYNTLNDAVNALSANGVDGSVTFNIRAGTYNEQITIPDITGTSSSNTITFTSETSDATSVIITHSATSSSENFIVKFDGAKHINFNYLTFKAENSSTLGRIIVFLDDSKYIEIMHNNFYSVGHNAPYAEIISSTLMSGEHVERIQIKYNQFQDSPYGVYFYGYSSSNFYMLYINDNSFSNITKAVYLNRVSTIEINKNTFDDVNEAILVQSISGGAINENKIKAHASGINVDYVSNFEIFNNSIYNDAVVWTGTQGKAYSLVVSNSSSTDVFYNSVFLDDTSTSIYSYAFGLFSSSSWIKIKNNIFCNLGKGYSVYLDNITTSSTFEMDYNNYFVGQGYLVRNGYYNTQYYFTLSQFQTEFGVNVHSTSYYPGFNSLSPLTPSSPWLDNTGNYESAVTEDINGVSRASSPDMGCVEFTADASLTTPMSGTYNIGTGYDYDNLSEALNDLLLKGTNGSVILNLHDGNYTGNYKLYNIPSSSGSNSVTISLGTGNPDLSYSATTQYDNYVFRLMGGTTMYSLNYLTLEATGSYYNKVLDIKGYNRFRIIGCSFTAPQTTYDSRDKDVINADNSYVYDGEFLYCDVTGGASGIYFKAFSSDITSDLEIYRSTFTDNYYGIYILYTKSPYIHENTINNSGYKGIYAVQLKENFKITKNKISLDNYNACGIELSSATGGDSVSVRGLVANNTIKLSESVSSGKGISYSYSQKTDIVFNSVNIMGSTGTSSALYAYSDNGDNVIKNNIFVSHNNNGKAVLINNMSSTTQMDYNDLYSDSDVLISLSNTSYSNIEELQNATGEHLHSVSIYPYFTDDMHTQSPSLNDRGVYLSIVSEDIDNEIRNNPPDMGADEYTPAAGLTPLSGTYTIGTSKSDFSSFTEAANALSYRGISDDVTFLVESGVYYERPEIRQYYTDDTSHIVIFKSQTANADDVVLKYGPTVSDSNYVVLISGADHIRFEDLSFATTYASNYYNTIIRVMGYSDNLQILNCKFSIPDSTNSSQNNIHIYFDSASFTSASIVNNSFSYGYYGIYQSSDNCEGISIDYNYFSHTKKPIHIANSGISNISHNIMEDFTQAINLGYIDSGFQIYNNKMVSNGFNGYYDSYDLVYLYSCNGISGGHIKIYNNLIYSNDNYLSGLTGLTLSNCTYVDLYHNNIVMQNNYDVYINASRGQALYLSGDNFDVKNNILAYHGNGYAWSIQPNNNVNYDIDYNDLYTESLFLAKNGQDKYQSLEDIRGNSTFSEHSVKAHPLLDSNLFTTSAFLVGKGYYNHQFANDYNNATRNNPPVIGATEYSPSSTAVLSGSYSIGNSGSDYSTIQQAMDDLIKYGLGTNDVTFNIQNGTYNEQLTLFYYPKETGSNASVTFKSVSENANDVNIAYDVDTNDDNYVLKLIGVNDLHFTHLTFSALDATENKVAVIKGNNKNLVFSNCKFEGYSGRTRSVNNIITFDKASFDNIQFTQNEFNHGSYAIYYSNYNYPEYASTLKIENNTFDSNNTAAYLKSISNLYITENSISGMQGDGLLLYNLEDTLKIYKNSIKILGGTVLRLENYTGASDNVGLIANNYLRKSSTTEGYYDLYLQQVNYLNVYMNSLVALDNSNVKSLYITGTNSNLNVRNNIFYNNANGLSLYVANHNGILNMEYNLLYTTGSYLAYWEGTYCTDLAQLVSVSGFNNSSINGDPAFLYSDKPDLSSTSLAINAGKYISDITEDIYGTTRTQPYDIGAYEYVGGITPGVPQNVTIQIVDNGSTARISWDASSQATQYKVEYSDNPTNGFTTATTTTNTTVDIPISTDKKFYRVRAIH